MTAIIIAMVIAVLLLLVSRASWAAPRQTVPRPPLSRRDIPIDQTSDPSLDPSIEPWADEVRVRLRWDERITDHGPFTPGDGDFGGGGASGDWDDDSSDESGAGNDD